MKKCLLNTGNSFSRQSVPSGLRGKRIYGPYFKKYGPQPTYVFVIQIAYFKISLGHHELTNHNLWSWEPSTLGWVGWLVGVFFCSFLKAMGTIASKCSLRDRAKLFPYTSYYYWQLLSVNRNFFPPRILLQNNNSAKKQINNGDLLVRVGGKSTATIS